mgnify:CR=1 FL=1
MISEDSRVCQSCGMPMRSREDLGTEADGALSGDYCIHCYRDGTFTEPDISIDEMAKLCSTIMSQLYEIPERMSEEFSKEHLSSLKRWAGREVAPCGSCGMPLLRDEDSGTEADGSLSTEYCFYCYQDGRFTEPELTEEQAIMKYAPMLASNLGIPPVEAEEMVQQYLLTLPRWQR